MNCFCHFGKTCLCCETKGFYRAPKTWGAPEVTRSGVILLNESPGKNNCCKKACNFAASTLQRFKTIGNTHHLLPGGLLASWLSWCFSLALEAYGTGRSCRPALATALGDERTVPVEPGLGVGRSWGSALDSGEGAGICSLTGRLLELGCSHGTQWQSCSSSVISISCWSGLGRKKGLEAKPVIKRRSGWFSLQGRSVAYGKWRYCCLYDVATPLAEGFTSRPACLDSDPSPAFLLSRVI